MERGLLYDTALPYLPLGHLRCGLAEALRAGHSATQARTSIANL